MVERLIRWSLERRAVVLAISALILVLGVWTTVRMPVDVFPDLTAPTVTILVEGEGLAPEEMERLVTFPIEATVNGASGVRRVRSSTALGIAVVWVEFEWGTDVFRARQTVAERLSGVTSALPRGVRTPKLAPQASIMGEILFVALTSDRHDLLELRRVATTIVRRRLISEPGVAQVTPIGGDQRQYQVVLEPRLLRAFDVQAEDVVAALERSNANVSAGLVVRGSEETLVQGVGRIGSIEDVERTVVASRGDRPVKVSDLGAVQVGAALKRGTAAAARRGPGGEPLVEPAVVFAITKQPGVNTLELTGRLDAVATTLQSSLPEGMVLNANLFRQAAFIQAAVGNTLTALIEGAGMVVIVVLLFLGSLRASLITLVAIPMSLAVAILALRAIGADINTMTLGGMAIAIGALVDDAIIDVENVVRRLRAEAAKPAEGRSSLLRVVLDASVEVRASIVFATLIILLVFSPIFALSGVEGRLLQPLGIAFSVGLAASLLTALTLTPAMCLWLLPRSSTVLGGREPRFVTALKQLYARPLSWSLRHPWLVAFPALALSAWAATTVARAGRNFLPEFNEGALVIGLMTAPGTSLAASDRLASRVEHVLMKHPEIVAMGRRTGRAEEDEHVQGVEATEIDLTLDMQAPARLGLRVRTKPELLAALRADVALVPGVQATFGQPISHRIDHMLSGSRASVAVKVFGGDLEELRRLAHEVEGRMRSVPGVVDLSVEQQVDVPVLRLEVDREAIARHGLQVEAVNTAIERVTRGQLATQVLEGTETYDLVVRVGDGQGPTPESLAGARIETPTGARVPLSALVRERHDVTPNFISRENAERRIVVQCNVAGRDLSGLVADVQAAVAAGIELPRGYWVEYGGQFESAEETARRLLILGALVIAGMAGLLMVVLRSARDAVLVLANLPLALIGGVAGLELSGGVVSVASLIGFITVFGVAARNGILLVSHVRHLQDVEGVTDLGEAVRRGAQERVAPILMTALAAGLALVPLAFRGDEPGSELLTPMAIVILSGLVTSTLLNMLLVPALLLHLGSARIRSAAPLAAALAAGCTSVDAGEDWQRAQAAIRAASGVESVGTPDEKAIDPEELLADGVTRDEALRLALAANPRVEAAFHAIGVARADLAQAGLLSNPALSLQFLFPSGGGRTEIQAALAQSVSDLWMLPRREAQAERALDVRILEASRLAAELAFAAGSTHDEALAAQARAALTRRALELARRAEDEAEILVQRGAARSLDVELARHARLRAEIEVLAAERERVESAGQLGRLLGLERALQPEELVGALPELPDELPDEAECVARALEARLDLRATRAAAEAAAERVPLERRRRLPELALGVHFERPDDGPDLFGPTATLSLPIFDTGEAAVVRAEREYNERAAQWRAAALEVAQDVRTALGVARVARAGLESARAGLAPHAEEVAAAAVRAHERGDVTQRAVLEAEGRIVAGAEAALQALAAGARARSSLERAAGLPFDALVRPSGADYRAP